jgi:peptidoglycan/LPS O-acetylase OafA/YrhL
VHATLRIRLRDAAGVCRVPWRLTGRGTGGRRPGPWSARRRPVGLGSPASAGEHERGPGFRPDVEGLRAVAVLAVVLFHAQVPGLPGGFVGVDVFFVISGFLITGMLWREVERTGRLRLGRFYGARARRLLPAGITVLVATAAAAAWLLPPLEARSVLVDGVASALYAGNYRFAVQGTDYLAADVVPSPFQHYWSLGVEEQFYLFWPALLLGTGWVVHRLTRRRAPRDHRSVTPYLALLAALAAASFAVSSRWTTTLPAWAFFSLPCRAWELAIGGVVALTAPWWRRSPALLAAASGWVGLGLVVAAGVRLGESTPYPGLAALAPVLGAALVVGGGCASPRRGVGSLLALAPMRAVGRLSYSWYLWHWPVLLLAPPLVGRSLGLAGRLSAGLLAAGLAVLTVRVVEDPVRFAASLRRSTGRSLLLGATTTATGAAAALVLLAVVPVPAGQGAAAPQPTIAPPSTPPPPEVDPGEAAVLALTAQVQAAVSASVGVERVPSNLTPTLDRAPYSKQAPFLEGCALTWTKVQQPDCTYGDPAGSVTVSLVGDSHAAQWQPALQSTAEQRHWRLQVRTKVTCPLLDLPIASPYLGREYVECEQWRSRVVDELRAAPPALIVLGMSRRYGDDFGFASYDPRWVDSLARTVVGLRTIAPVLVLGPIPDPHGNVPTCLSEHLATATACAPTRGAGLDDVGIAAEEAAVTAGGGEYADLADLFCTADRCPVIVGNTLVFRDDNHVTVEYATLLGPVLSALVEESLSGG